MDAVGGFFELIEGPLNIAGYIPILSSLTGAIRAVIGAIQIVLGWVLTAIGTIFMVLFWIIQLKGKVNPALYFASFWTRVAANGHLNIMRGSVESVPVLGNLATFFYDRARKGKFILPYAR